MSECMGRVCYRVRVPGVGGLWGRGGNPRAYRELAGSRIPST